MLAILQIKMSWTKDSRTPIGSRQRQEYYKPILIENDVSLSGNGIFVKTCNYWQQNGVILYNVEVSEKLDRQLSEDNIGVAFTGEKEYEQKWHDIEMNAYGGKRAHFTALIKLTFRV